MVPAAAHESLWLFFASIDTLLLVFSYARLWSLILLVAGRIGGWYQWSLDLRASNVEIYNLGNFIWRIGLKITYSVYTQLNTKWKIILQDRKELVVTQTTQGLHWTNNPFNMSPRGISKRKIYISTFSYNNFNMKKKLIQQQQYWILILLTLELPWLSLR